jgi:hypothetical protein
MGFFTRSSEAPRRATRGDAPRIIFLRRNRLLGLVILVLFLQPMLPAAEGRL